MATRSRTRSRSRSTRRLSTREYHLPVSRTWSGANYAYPRGAGKDRGKRPSYPIRPKARARSARARASSSRNAGTLKHVDNAIRHVYGSVDAIYPGRRSGGRGTARRRHR